ncbi:alpha/beta hydrolase [Saccharopolyspora hattusasensis]|uniref:alpha/beta hydrolase n=1 Tax=Saccharopolyspora hattusasensis TaxID=1128679 RepID=UPI003D958B07
MSDDVRVEELTFASDDNQLAADLYLPAEPAPHPAVVMAGGWCYVKELAQPTYARALAASGIAALVFDYRNMGASTGQPRQHMDPWQQVADYRNAVSYLEQRPEIDGDRLGAWGISYSGGHVLILGALDERIRAVCGVVPVTDGYENMRLAHGTVGFRRFTAALREARRKRYATGEITYIDHQPATEGDLATWPFPKSRVAFAELKAREAPRYEGRSTAESAELLLAYNVFPYLGRLLGKPTKFVIAEGDDHTHWDLALRAFDQIPGTSKELTIISSANHLTLYSDRDRQNSTATDIARFFTESL